MIFSVITIMLNEARLLPVALASVKAQQGVELEHIIVDGGSTDESLSIARRYAAVAGYPVKVVSQKSKGLYAAINEGLAAASGDVAAVLHANDAFASPCELAEVEKRFAETGADIVYGDVRYENPDAPGKVTRRYSARLFSPQKLLDGFFPPHPATFTSIPLMRRHGLYDEGFRLSADFEMMVRMLLRCGARAAYLPREIVVMSSGGLSSRLANRLWYNNLEKYRALRRNGIGVSPLRLLKRYIYLFRK